MNKVKFISLVSFVTALTFFCLSIPVYGLGKTHAITGIVASLVLLLPWGLSAVGIVQWGKITLSIFLPVFICGVSVTLKLISPVKDPFNMLNSLYFTRMLLLMCIAIPFITVRLSNRKLLILGAVIPSLCLLLIDGIHWVFGVAPQLTGTPSLVYYITSNSASILATGTLIASMIYLKTRIEDIEFKYRKKIGHLELYLTDLISLSNSPAVLNGETDNTYQQVAEKIRNSLKVSRVSLWEFNLDHTEIRCKFLLDQDGIQNKPMITLSSKDHERYFEAIKRNKLVIATDAQNHGATKSFTHSYLKPLNILSIMDIAFMNDGRLAGIICCEQQDEHKRWFVEDSLFLSAMGDTVSYMHSNRKKILRNEELEEHVRLRTKELERKNEQLSEYAYINSHVLRAPVARIMGIFELFDKSVDNQIEQEIMRHFKLSVEELDNITLQIKQAIEEYGRFDRNNLTQQIHQ